MRRIFRLCALVLIGGAGSAFPAWTAAYDDTLEGSWTAEQTGGQSGSPKEGALRFMRAGNGTLTGTMRLGNDETVLFDVLEMGTNVSFTIIIPGTPYVAVHYTGTRAGDAIRLAGAGDNQTAYTLTGRRVASSMPAATAAAIAPAPPPPVVAAAPPPAAAPVSQLDGNWAAEQTGPNSATSVTGSLAFTGNRGTLKTGGEEWPLFDVQITGADVGFTMVIPGTPYLTVHYSGTAMGDALQLSGLDADQRMFHLTARRGGKTPVARAAP
ncbi:MAG TPA: hypothetical protein VNH44_04525, partial [Micropepsaceae bacterium]|nr:hypothetical protein [Micropepsaceae bacterium]